MGPTLESEYKEIAWGITDLNVGYHSPIIINRPKVTDHLVKVKVKYCSICHSDIHCGLNHWGNCKYPFVGGHEVAGIVQEVGAKVKKFRVGDPVGVGVIHDSCMECTYCKRGEENYCSKGMIEQYDSWKDQSEYDLHIGGNETLHTMGGYSGSVVSHERFVVKAPEKMPLEKLGPILCAGVTVYDPLKYYGATKGKPMCIGIAGVGGLGTMGIKIAKSFGHKVIAYSYNKKKRELALSKGADEFVTLN